MLIFNVDDDFDDKELFQYAVKTAHPAASCVFFENGQDLLDSLKKIKLLPDYIFVDINMPKMDGYECVREIKSDTNLKHIKIIMHSTAFTPKDIIEFNGTGIGFLIKRISLFDLIQDIKSIIA